ncbi:restriction endonuclease subunit S [Vibrio fluvialis]|uniref:restriction endonuclease subunit S n=1 Tax=Vibrio fluvialis TaxID=676 RepID=UPI0015595F55|nr:restriction endonuclease subunit S [Vibrio fluvialis]EKO3954418.1 restriction endonuclease subunit S [Vibrio fluvialis]
MSWPMVKLGDIAPSKPLKNPVVLNEDKVWQLNLDMVESQSGRIISKSKAPVNEAGSSTHWFDERHVLYSKLRPYLNKVVLPDEQGIATTELIPMFPNAKKLDRKYLAYYLRSTKFVNWISDQVAGAKMPRVSMKVFWEHEIPLPPLAEQKRIAAILDKADAIRRKRQQAIELADEFLRSVFLDMFGDPVMNPKGWDISRLPSHGTFKNGLNFSKEDSGISLRYLGVGDFKSLTTITDMQSLGRVELNECPAKDYLLKNGDLVFVRSNGNKALVGRCISVYPDGEALTFSGFCIRYRVEDSEIEPEYLNYLLRTPSMKQAMLKGGQGANIQNINQKILSSLSIPLPPLQHQQVFCEVVKKFRKTMHRIVNNKTEADTLFGSLSQKAFSGMF